MNRAERLRAADTEEERNELLLDGIRFKFDGDDTSPVFPFYWQDRFDIPSLAFWTEASHIFSLLASLARQQKEALEEKQERKRLITRGGKHEAERMARNTPPCG